MDAIIHLILVLTFSILSCSGITSQLTVAQSEPWQVFASKVLSLKCSDYVIGTNSNDSFEWTGNYVFETVQHDRIVVPVKNKWRNVGKIMVTCSVKRARHQRVKAHFSVTFEPMLIDGALGKGSPGYITIYFLIIVGVSAALSILCCTLLLVRKLRRSGRRYLPKLELLSEIASSRLSIRDSSKVSKSYKPYTILGTEAPTGYPKTDAEQTIQTYQRKAPVKKDHQPAQENGQMRTGPSETNISSDSDDGGQPVTRGDIAKLDKDAELQLASDKA